MAELKFDVRYNWGVRGAVYEDGYKFETQEEQKKPLAYIILCTLKDIAEMGGGQLPLHAATLHLRDDPRSPALDPLAPVSTIANGSKIFARINRNPTEEPKRDFRLLMGVAEVLRDNNNQPPRPEGARPPLDRRSKKELMLMELGDFLEAARDLVSVDQVDVKTAANLGLLVYGTFDASYFSRDTRKFIRQKCKAKLNSMIMPHHMPDVLRFVVTLIEGATELECGGTDVWLETRVGTVASAVDFLYASFGMPTIERFVAYNGALFSEQFRSEIVHRLRGVASATPRDPELYGHWVMSHVDALMDELSTIEALATLGVFVHAAFTANPIQRDLREIVRDNMPETTEANLVPVMQKIKAKLLDAVAKFRNQEHEHREAVLIVIAFVDFFWEAYQLPAVPPPAAEDQIEAGRFVLSVVDTIKEKIRRAAAAPAPKAKAAANRQFARNLADQLTQGMNLSAESNDVLTEIFFTNQTAGGGHYNNQDGMGHVFLDVMSRNLQEGTQPLHKMCHLLTQAHFVEWVAVDNDIVTNPELLTIINAKMDRAGNLPDVINFVLKEIGDLLARRMLPHAQAHERSWVIFNFIRAFQQRYLPGLNLNADEVDDVLARTQQIEQMLTAKLHEETGTAAAAEDPNVNVVVISEDGQQREIPLELAEYLANMLGGDVQVGTAAAAAAPAAPKAAAAPQTGFRPFTGRGRRLGDEIAEQIIDEIAQQDAERNP